MIILEVKYNIPSGFLAQKYWFWHFKQKKNLQWGSGALYRSLLNSPHNCSPTYWSNSLWSMHPSFLFQGNRVAYLTVTFVTAVLFFPLVWNWQPFRSALPIWRKPGSCVCVCVWHCGGGNDGSLERVGLLTQQRGMFSFGRKAFLRDLRRGCGQNKCKSGVCETGMNRVLRGLSALLPLPESWSEIGLSITFVVSATQEVFGSSAGGLLNMQPACANNKAAEGERGLLRM